MSNASRQPDDLELLLSGLLDGSLSDADERRLMDLVIVDADVRARYLDIMDVHAMLTWERSSQSQGDLPTPETDVIEAESIPVAKLAPASPPGSLDRNADRYVRPLRIPGFRRYAVAASLLLAMGVTFALVRQSHRDMKSRDASPAAYDPAVATITNVHGAEWDAENTLTDLGSTLPTGRLRLRSGSAELVMRSTAAMTLLGPADVELIGPNRCRLTKGRIVAQVPEMAHGFTVETPTSIVTDLGTHFGVEVDETGAVEVHVFRGLVVARANGETMANGVQLEEGDAWRLSPTAKSATAARTVPVDYRRFGLGVPRDLVTFNTGRRIAEGQVDANWMVREPGGVDASPIVVSHTEWMPNDPAASQWLAARVAPGASPSMRLIYTTRFNLSGLDPSTGRLKIRFAVDNRVESVRLNGHTFTPPSHPLEYRELTAFEIDEGFVEGENVLEFEVLNGEVQAPENPIALRVELSGTAQTLETQEQKQ
ncbi:MAG: hypothetical protein GC159_20340 [Phycisphaera sp.]|nr:hypothetical protein [Phycisphaera sp.]